MYDERPLFELAEHQLGAFTRAQARELGIHRSVLNRWAARGLVEQCSPQVFRVAGSPNEDRQRLMIEVLQHHPATACRSSAAAVWGLPGFTLLPAQVISIRDTHRRTAQATGHSSRRLPDNHVTAVDGIPVTTPARTIFDLAGDPAMHTGRVERALDTAWARRLVTYRSLHEMLPSLAKRGRPGIRLMRTLLDDRPVDYRPPESGLESRFRQLLAEAGLPPMERQVDVGDEAGWIGRVDFIDRTNRVIVQIDSDLFHGSLLDQQRDAAQTAALHAAGYTVVRIVEFDLWHRKDSVLSQLRTLRKAA